MKTLSPQHRSNDFPAFIQSGVWKHLDNVQLTKRIRDFFPRMELRDAYNLALSFNSLKA